MDLTCFAGRLAPEWFGLGNVRTAFFVDMDEICKLLIISVLGKDLFTCCFKCGLLFICIFFKCF